MTLVHSGAGHLGRTLNNEAASAHTVAAAMPLPITLSTPLAEGDLQLEAMTLSGGLSQLGDWQVALLSDKSNLQPEALLGQRVTVSVAQRDERVRSFNGYVTRFGIGTSRGRMNGYHATLRPWLWFLTRTSDCRIFQQQTVPDIVKTVFDEHACASYEFRLYREYREREYCVQYCETDFNFVARLLEGEGIYWYFEHGEDQHTLVLADSLAAHEMAQGTAGLPYFENRGTRPPDRDFVSAWRVARGVRTGHVAMSSFDFKRPTASLLVDKQRPREHRLADYELFDYAGAYTQREDGEQYLDNWIDELHSRYETLRGMTNAGALECGRLMSLSGHPRDDQNAEYLVTATAIRLEQSVGESSGAHHDYSCDFTAIPASQQFRPPRTTAKPVMRGPQTAIVVGPAGDEIHTDPYGRVKVQFHWDRYGQRDENSSCWIRVSHPWAGRGWGAVSIPRIGQEVIVDFLEGDPDQPIITGRVYNGDSMPPFDLPAAAVVSGLRSNTHKGQGYNAMTMDDTAGREKITIHAQYDMDTTVEHDQTTSVKNNRVASVTVDDVLNVDANRTVHVKSKLTETIDGGQETTVSAGYTETISGGVTSTINGSLTSTINDGASTTVNGDSALTVNGSRTMTVSAALTESINGDHTTTVGGKQAVSAGSNLDLSAQSKGTFTCANGLKLIVGGSSIELSPGAITLSSGGSTLQVDASGIALTGAKISLNG